MGASPRREPAEEPRRTRSPPERYGRDEICARFRFIAGVRPIEKELRVTEPCDCPYVWPLALRKHLDTQSGEPHSAVEVARLLREKCPAIGPAGLALARFDRRGSAVSREPDPAIE